jgi:hypothetical protein
VQFYAQCCGAVVSIFMSAGLYVVFSTAYPCINDLALASQCSFPAPDVQSWRAIMVRSTFSLPTCRKPDRTQVAVTSTELPVPPSSGYTAIGLAVAAILTVIAKYRYIPAQYHHLVPNWYVVFLLDHRGLILLTCLAGPVSRIPLGAAHLTPLH